MRTITTIVATLFLVVLAFGADNKQLSDKQLASVTAGDDYSLAPYGTVVANHSTATVTNSGSVTVDGSLSDATGLNIFNSSVSKVAAGNNILALADGSTTPDAVVDQSNTIDQTSSASGPATISAYSRDPELTIGAASLSVSTTVSDSATVSDTFSKDSSLTVDKSKTLDASFSSDFSRTRDRTFDASADGSVPSFTVSATDSSSKSKSIDATLSKSKTFSLSKTESVSNDFSASATHDASFTSDLTLSDIEYRGALSFDEASGSNVVVDGSTLTSMTTYAVELTGGAENGATGVNIVNAAGSLVAIGNNIVAAAPTSDFSTLSLTQTNSITQH